MFSRSVSIRLKPNSVAEFTKLIEDEALPLLRKQKGFQGELTFVAPGGGEAVGISLWDQKENAEAYSRDAYPQLLKALGKVAEGTPQVRTYEVANSTFHQIAARVAGKIKKGEKYIAHKIEKGHVPLALFEREVDAEGNVQLGIGLDCRTITGMSGNEVVN